MYHYQYKLDHTHARARLAPQISKLIRRAVGT